ncbi:sensor histidine kinase [Arthrobacter sp. BL-252-APC-1A]|uniref:sensor histidine kinase n=1 Tax=Arthrobacter sp. BL-252-APC-1A TaxID=2606622 RepID=UPI0012B3E42B|nr:sensor histidine kinase [Arthrobacter sp. BL-252-APC-1A]MSS00222.1 sensor histidine kinase [Arthrobacter sp. BL-252-APC-1A]
MSAELDRPRAGERVLRVLRLALHVGFALLLAVAVGRMLLMGPLSWVSFLALLLSAVLAAVYVIGTVAEKRASDGGRGRRALRFDPERHGLAWLGAVTGLWALLLVLSPDFSWLAFPLFFLQLHLLPLRPALLAVTVTTAAVVAAQWAHAGEFHAAMLLGPLIGAGFAVIMALAYQALYAEVTNQREALDELHRTRAELARSQREQGVLEERGRLAREIHDTLAQGLASIVLMSRSARASLDAGNLETVRERLGTVEETAAENLAEARQFVRNLRGSENGGGSLVDRLERACRSVQERAAAQGQELACSFRLEGVPAALPAPYEVAVLRAVQATLANVLQHASASRAVVTLAFVGRDVTLDIFDDGRGFDPVERARSGPRHDGSGYGLISIADRVEALGGRMDLESVPGEGTAVGIRLPLPDARQAAADLPASVPGQVPDAGGQGRG